jgi:ribosomal protein S18 acetylase RimI-like enzyme
VEPGTVLRAFDEQVRRRPDPGPGGAVERDGRIVRVIARGWRGVVWSDLDRASADAVVAGEVERFAAEGGAWEWKHYSHDRPDDLPHRLAAAGFVAGQTEALMVAEVAALDLDVAPPPGIELRTAGDDDGVDAVVRVHELVFGTPHDDLGATLRGALVRSPPSVLGVVAYAGADPVAAGRVELGAGTEFAGLWGGGTLPAFRRRGIFRALVAHRAGLAAARGRRYVQVDALPTSAPILRRIGFVELARTTPYVHAGSGR